jgi:dethiobiotin synthetase
VHEAAALARGADAIVVEGVGGLLVPLNATATVRDLAVALGLPLLVAGHPGLGTINHTLLTVEAARAAGLEVRAVVLGPWPARPTVMEESNRDTIAARAGVAVACLPAADDGTPAELERIGAGLPVADWLPGSFGQAG